LTPQEQVRQHLIDEPAMQTSVIGRETKSGGYAAAIATRTPAGIQCGVVEWESAEHVPVTLIAVIKAMADGKDPRQVIREWVAAEKAALAPDPEPPKTRSHKEKANAHT